MKGPIGLTKLSGDMRENLYGWRFSFIVNVMLQKGVLISGLI